MFELDQDVAADTIEMFITVAPRDPRGGAPRSEDAIEYLEPVTLDELAEQFLNLGIPAQVMEGAEVGAPGWVIARTLGLRDGRALRWAPEENTTDTQFPTMPFADLARFLAEHLNTDCHLSDQPNIPVVKVDFGDVVVDSAQHGTALVGKYRSNDGPLIAHDAQEDVWFAHNQPWSVVAGTTAEADLGGVLMTSGMYPVVGFERNGHWRRVVVSMGGHVQLLHEWGPQWQTVDPRVVETEEIIRLLSRDEENVADLVLDHFATPRATAQDFADFFELSEVELDRLGLVLAAPEMDDPFTAVARILGLPEQAAEVAEGWRDPATLDNACRVETQGLSAAVWSSLTTSPTESDVSAKISRLWIERPPSYYVLNGVETAAWAGLAVAAKRRGRRKLSVVCGVFAALSLADFFVPAKWRGRKP
ncbi:hypothetical protein [Timonella sp. A28]|uniref:hypothetical protein n=1 Tax=Timonella sp. A28 TaxID=3442640 RepID=UPI003EC00259